MRLVIHPLSDPQREVDVTRRLVAAIAAELWRLYGGNEKLNWIEAEGHLEHALRKAGAAAVGAETGRIAPTTTVGDPVGGQPAATMVRVGVRRTATRHASGKVSAQSGAGARRTNAAAR